jgi:DnaJ-class molecular chaperone
MAAQFHPDKHTGLPAEEHAAMAQKFQKIQSAAETLKGKRVQKGQVSEGSIKFQ